ncbi:MAG TPA: hypothetical protein DIU15_14250 [Deltaproteobacteria bacterium]|nr:hypothetical protein [Deltaproteobacteria bacterium]HCP47200.1 hypothetical protein [Deltaproteobacteria bacterium]
MSETLLRIAVVGDVHGHWNEADVQWFNNSALDLLLLVGDLAGYRHAGSIKVARSLAQLRLRTVWVPGNHDSAHPLQLLGEMLKNESLIRSFARGQDQRMADIRRAAGGVETGGYSIHTIPEADLAVVAARPHSMGGPRLGFRPYLERAHGVASIEASTQRLKALVAGSQATRLIFLAHNGPTGLGGSRMDPWGCDFRPSQGDFGDPDLAQAIAHARALGKTVLAVVAGHMHRRLKGGGIRTSFLEQDDIVYVNAAEVPRILRNRKEGSERRHHVELRVLGHGCEARDVWVEATGPVGIPDDRH